VGWFSSEEVNVGGKGANFGWPYFEGNDRTTSYSGFGGANSFYNSPTGINAIKPVYRYREASSGNAVIGGAVFTSGGSYKNTYFVGDASRGTVDAISFNTAGDPNSGYKSIERVASGLYGVVQLTMAPDGSMYYVQIGGGPQGGEVGRWRPA
jgi:glucose/arabinose dehydrogenase